MSTWVVGLDSLISRGGFDPPHHRHPKVHQDDVGRGRTDEIDGFPAVARLPHDEQAFPLENRSEHPPVLGIVVHDENPGSRTMPLSKRPPPFFVLLSSTQRSGCLTGVTTTRQAPRRMTVTALGRTARGLEERSVPASCADEFDHPDEGEGRGHEGRGRGPRAVLRRCVPGPSPARVVNCADDDLDESVRARPDRVARRCPGVEP
jgi:hypothetical protein